MTNSRLTAAAEKEKKMGEAAEQGTNLLGTEGNIMLCSRLNCRMRARVVTALGWMDELNCPLTAFLENASFYEVSNEAHS